MNGWQRLQTMAFVLAALVGLVSLGYAADATGALRGGTAMVPVRGFSNAFGISLAWDGATSRTTLDGWGVRMALTSGSSWATIRGSRTELPAAPYLRDGSMMAPARSLCDAFGIGIEADLSKGRVVLSRKTTTWVVAVSRTLPGSPGVRITDVPPSGAGSSSWGEIGGTVTGVDPASHYVVVYAGTDQWYVQPYTASPYTSISDDGTWQSGTHLGWRYGALLVRKGYDPPLTPSSLPGRSRNVLATTTVPAR